MHRIIQAQKEVLFVVRVPSCVAQRRHEPESESEAGKGPKNTEQQTFVFPVECERSASFSFVYRHLVTFWSKSPLRFTGKATLLQTFFRSMTLG